MHQNSFAMKGKKLIFWIAKIFHWGWLLNLTFAGGIIGFQILNLLNPQKSISSAYLGKFRFEIYQEGITFNNPNHSKNYYFTDTTAQPSVKVNSFWHPYLVLIFTLIVLTISLFYNYQFKLFFSKLNQSIQEGTPFHSIILTPLQRVTWFSMAVFILGSILSILKIIYIPSIAFEGFKAIPVYDNLLINFFWFSMGMYIIIQIISVGIELKNEQDLTI